MTTINDADSEHVYSDFEDLSVFNRLGKFRDEIWLDEIIIPRYKPIEDFLVKPKNKDHVSCL